MPLRKYQQDAVDELFKYWEKSKRPCILQLATGCHEASHKILMADGSVKRADEIQVGDYLMGRNCPTKVIELHRGSQEMFRVVPVKGEPFVVNAGHILHVLHYFHHNEGGKRVWERRELDISVRDYLIQSKTWKHCTKLMYGGYNYGKNPNVEHFEPYLIGAYLGDGQVFSEKYRQPVITNVDIPVIEKCRRIIEKQGWEFKNLSDSKDWSIKSGGEFKRMLFEVGAMNKDELQRQFPNGALSWTAEARAELLAGFLDTDGSKSRNVIDFIQKNKQIAVGVARLAKSLGIMATVSKSYKSCQTFKGKRLYWRVCISGKGLDSLPMVKHSVSPNRQKKNQLLTGFSVESCGDGEYYGWEVDAEDHLYFDGNLMLHHNSGKSHIIADIVSKMETPTLILQPTKEILEQNLEKLNAVGVYPQICSASAGDWKIGDVTLATIGTIRKWAEYCQRFQTIIVDECLDGDCEVLTPVGWQKISEMPKEIAQWQEGELSFVKPSRWVKKKPLEKVVKTTWGGNSGSGEVVYMTQNHRQLTHDMNWHSFRDKDRVFLAKDLQARDSLQIYTAQKQTRMTGEVPYSDMLKIAICADGHIEKRKDGRTWVRLSFRRERKIKRAEWLLKKNNLTYEKAVNARGDTSFCFHFDCTKSLNQLEFTLDYTVNRYRAVELMLWDGSSKPSCHRYYADSLENAEIARTIGILGGFTTRIRRYESAPNMWYVILVDADHTTTANLKKELVDYDKYMYCPTVPASFFLVKKGNFIFVTGNCDVIPNDNADSMYMTFFNELPNAKIVGLTATPFRNQTFQRMYEDPRVYCRPVTRIHTNGGKDTFYGEWFWNKIIYRCSIADLQELGYLSKTQYYVASTDWSFIEDVPGRVEYEMEQMTQWVDVEENTSTFTRAIKWCMENNLKTIVFSPNINMNFQLNNVITSLGGKSSTLDSTYDNRKTREAKMNALRSGEIQFLVNVGMVGRGVDVPSVDCVLWTRPTKSLSFWMQGVGRCPRIDPNNPNKIAYIVDLTDNYERFGKAEDITIEKIDAISKTGRPYKQDAIIVKRNGRKRVWDRVS